jgi:dTMP kinase
MEVTIPADFQVAELAVATRGRFVVLEGVDGCGKSTQLEALSRWLPTSGLLAAGAELVVTREPGGTALGAALRQLLLHPPGEAAPQPMEQCIRPALAAGHWVLSDRFSGSTAAYQGYGRGLDLARIAQLEQLATGGLAPDLTLWLELPLAESLRRRGERTADRIEASGEVFLQRVIDGFAVLAAGRGWRRVDATGAPEQVAAACRGLLAELVAGSPP